MAKYFGPEKYGEMPHPTHQAKDFTLELKDQSFTEIRRKLGPFPFDKHSQRELSQLQKDLPAIKTSWTNAPVYYDSHKQYYEGDVVDKVNLPHGMGQQYKPGSYLLEGFFRTGAPNGYVRSINNFHVQEGEMIKGKFTGFGIQTSLPNKEYQMPLCRRIGMFENGIFTNFGFESFDTGQWYLGHLKDEKFEGYGKLRTAQGYYLEGNFKENKLQGQGVIFMKTKTEPAQGHFYQGKFKDSVLLDGGGVMGVYEKEKGVFHLYEAVFEGSRVVSAKPMQKIIDEVEFRIPGRTVIEI
ncbi:hypothetical protein FGO68_gene5611 [Halteria grandinella]|uniref:MORN repeat protein n=1 Tax=Halteria grandinella TaxID=5974 RepID=A0A8J8NMN8_HALGN|nr:hypothetical protein FGO68_gene5611 [Halteria grandinella]